MGDSEANTEATEKRQGLPRGPGTVEERADSQKLKP